MSRRPAIAVLALASFAAWAAPEEFSVEPGHTFPSFEVAHLGISTQRGRFERTSGRIVLDREARGGRIELDIDAATVSTGNRAIDGVLRGADFLDVAAHPVIRFRSEAIEYEGDVPRRASGELTLAGRTRPVTVNVERFGCTRLPFFVRLTCGADIAGVLRRSDFGMGAYGGLVGEEVRLRIQVEAVRQEAASEPAAAGG